MQLAGDRQIGDEIVLDRDRAVRGVDRGGRKADLLAALENSVEGRAGRDTQSGLDEPFRWR
jgi:hypothetical protein